MIILSDSPEKTKEIAKDFVKEILSRRGVSVRTTGLANEVHKAHKALVVALSGDLGSGKTAFVQAVAAALGVEDNVTSPTFVIEKIYELPAIDFSHLIHIDAYRLNGGKELSHLGWEEISSDPRNIIFIEWPELVADIIPEDSVRLSFKFIDEKTREISIKI